MPDPHHVPAHFPPSPHVPCPSPFPPDLVAGTLRDQLLYPEPPRAVWATASPATRARVQPFMKSLRMGEEELEERLCA